jgi:threonine dehydrogenase-like Zn-dependent dehydrogenase
MADKMQAVVVHAYGDFRLEEVPRPQAGPGEVVIRVGGAGICAADRKFYTHGPWKLLFPFITGHEVAGVVVELGEGAAQKHGLTMGDKVAVEPVIPCGQCWYCQRGEYQICTSQQFIGVTINGGWAESTRLPANARMYKVPQHVPLTEAAMAEPVSCGVYAVEKAGIGLDDVVVISGMGPIGLSALQVARLKHPRLLIALDIDDAVLRVASELGAQVVFNVSKVDAPAEIRKLTDGRGCDLYMETSGQPAAINTGIDALRKGGKLFIYGVYGQPATVDFNQVSEFKELAIQGGHLSPHRFPLAIRYIADGVVNAKRMITHVFDLKDFAKAVELKLQKEIKEPVIKVTFDPSRGTLK